MNTPTKQNKMRIVSLSLPFIFFLFLIITTACTNRERTDNVVEDTLDVAPVNVVESTIVDTAKVLKDSLSLDSTDLDRNYNYKGSYMYLSKTKMRLYVLSAEDSVVFSCGIACGLKRGNKEAFEDCRTPEGRFHICGMYESTDWVHKTRDGRKVKGCYGPHFLSLATGKFQGIGIHGTNAPWSIGKRASEGCIRVNSKNIEILYHHYAYNGMPVIISGERERLPKFEGMGREVRSAAAWQKKMEADSLRRAAELATVELETVDSLPMDTSLILKEQRPAMDSIVQQSSLDSVKAE